MKNINILSNSVHHFNAVLYIVLNLHIVDAFLTITGAIIN